MDIHCYIVKIIFMLLELYRSNRWMSIVNNQD